MKQQSQTRKYSLRMKTLIGLAAIVFVIVAMAPILDENRKNVNNPPRTVDKYLTKSPKDSLASVKAFANVYKVLMSPRCMNCHPAGDVPLQGEDSHLHTMTPKRGIDGQGLYAMKCSNCHQPTNTPGLHTPPGNPKWHLPPANMKMVFEGKTPHELAKQLVNPKLNGNKNFDKLIEHVSDTLVRAGWYPGEGRSLPPLSYQEFKKEWITWIEKGAYAPKK